MLQKDVRVNQKMLAEWLDNCEAAEKRLKAIYKLPNYIAVDEVADPVPEVEKPYFGPMDVLDSHDAHQIAKAKKVWRQWAKVVSGQDTEVPAGGCGMHGCELCYGQAAEEPQKKAHKWEPVFDAPIPIYGLPKPVKKGILMPPLEGDLGVRCPKCNNPYIKNRCHVIACGYGLVPRTQKAKGVLNGPGAVAGWLVNLRLTQWMLYRPDFHTPEDTEALKFPLFMRPCPMRPRHGFVDSQIVNNLKQFREVCDAALAEDPQAEFLLGKYLEPSWNAVLTPATLTLGLGHDGATGKAGATTFPVISNELLGLTDLRKVGVDTSPYIEAVGRTLGHDLDVFFTQLRDGPKVTEATGADFVPAKGAGVVKKVFLLNRDYSLLDWERLVDTFKKGTVVYNQQEFGMGSHYAVHCIVNDIPFITTFEPKPGMVLEPTKLIKAMDPKKFIDGLRIGFSWKETDAAGWGALAAATLAVLHNSIAFGPTESTFAGFGVAVGVRLGLMALYGESRHKARAENGNAASRTVLYRQAWSNTGIAIELLPELLIRWDKYSKGGSIGGPAWKACQVSLQALLKAIQDFNRAKTEPRQRAVMRRCILALNNMINTAHNNGKWFNKFIGMQWFDVAAQCPAAVALVCGGLILAVNSAPVPERSLVDCMGYNDQHWPQKKHFLPWEGYTYRESEGRCSRCSERVYCAHWRGENLLCCGCAE